jgi:Uma2 family endonuclease
MVTAIAKPITVEDYLAQEEIADEKSEFIQGKIIKMTGATANHNILTGKLHARLLLALEDLNYSVFMSDLMSRY